MVRKRVLLSFVSRLLQSTKSQLSNARTWKQKCTVQDDTSYEVKKKDLQVKKKKKNINLFHFTPILECLILEGLTFNSLLYIYIKTFIIIPGKQHKTPLKNQNDAKS